jgi:hypothetical protein
MKRKDWEQQLSDYFASIDIEALGAVPCAKFAAGAVHAQTGVDCHAPYSGKYKTETGAAKVLRTLGTGNLESTFDLHLDRRESPAFAQRGDIVFNGEAVGVCIGATAYFIADGELTQYPRGLWAVAWASETARG